MRHPYTEALKNRVRPWLFRTFYRGRPRYACPICGYEGPFKHKTVDRQAKIVRADSKCPACASTERHRMVYLVLRELFADQNPAGKSILHVAPEACLQPFLSGRFETYHTCDLLRDDVDFKEDIQRLSFEDGSYDCVLVSRVLTIPPDLSASLDEIRRVLRRPGIAIVAETFKREETLDYGGMVKGRSREIGLDLVGGLRDRFDRVEPFVSNRYDERYQLTNRVRVNGRPVDDYPDRVRVPGDGFMDMVLVCHS